MAVAAIDHIHVRTKDVAATIAFFHDVLDMTPKIPPGADSMEHGCWLYDTAGRPLIHVGPADGEYPSDKLYPFKPMRGSGSVHHIAFACEDLPAMTQRLDKAGLQFSVNEIPQISLTQVFVEEANGILLELNFRSQKC